MKTFESDKYSIKIGTNARENWNLLDYALPEDIFIHLNNCHSPYVIIIKNYNRWYIIWMYHMQTKFLGEAILKNNINIVTI